MYDNLYNNQGTIVLLVHGVMGNETTYDCMLNVIDESFSFMEIKKYDGLYININNMESNQILSDLYINKANYIHKKVLIEVLFEHNWVGRFADQASELKTIIDAIKNNLCEEVDKYKIILVGHSKGGLISLQFVLDYPNIVDGILCINSPLNGPHIIDYFWWGLLELPSSDAKNNLYNSYNNLIRRWNLSDSCLLPKLICLATETNNSKSDGTVPNSSALGEGNPDFPEFDINYDYIYDKIKISGPGDGYKHKGNQCLANHRVVYQVLLLINRLTMKSNISGYYNE